MPDRHTQRTFAEPQTRAAAIAIATTAIFIIALAIRLIHYRQSLWCDEMTALLEYVSAPWAKIVAPKAGQYVPNNHVLFTILAKLCLQTGRCFKPELSTAAVVALIRLPSLLAGALTPVVLAWPLRHRAPVLAVLVAFFAAVNPWLVAFSDEARGYSLMILLGIVATNLLPNKTRGWPIAYGLVIAAMLYTVQVAGMLVIAHLCCVVMFRRNALGTWIRGMLIAGAITVLLLLPMSRGILFYYRHPLLVTADVADFANQLPRFASCGQYVPLVMDPAMHIPAFTGGFVCWLLPVLVLAVGSGLGWRLPELELPMAVMASATLLFFAVAMFNPETAQVRFAPWCGLWLILSIASISYWVHERWGISAMAVVAAVAGGWFLVRDVMLLPSQPVQQAMLLADQSAPPRAEIVMALLSADQAVDIYGKEMIRHPPTVAADFNSFYQAERDSIAKTGTRPWVVMSFEYLPHDFRPQFWDYLQAHYQLQARLPGRVSPVAIYAPRPG